MTDEPASLLLVYCDNILARILAQISANFHVKYKRIILYFVKVRSPKALAES